MVLNKNILILLILIIHYACTTKEQPETKRNISIQNLSETKDINKDLINIFKKKRKRYKLFNKGENLKNSRIDRIGKSSLYSGNKRIVNIPIVIDPNNNYANFSGISYLESRNSPSDKVFLAINSNFYEIKNFIGSPLLAKKISENLTESRFTFNLETKFLSTNNKVRLVIIDEADKLIHLCSETYQIILE